MTDVLDELRRADPVDRDELASGTVPREPLDRIFEQPVIPRRRRGLATRGARSAILVAGAGALAATLTFAALPDGRDDRKDQPSAITSGLLAAARAAESHPRGAATDGYDYTRMEITSLATQATDPVFSLLIRKAEERWVGPDGSGRLVVTPRSPKFPSPRDEKRWIEAGRPLGFAKPTDQEVNAFELASFIDPSLPPTGQLPDDPTVLGEMLSRVATGGDAPVNVKTFELVAALLAQPAISPDLRAALFTVASRIDGIENLGTTRDPLGRPGQAVALRSNSSGSWTRELLIYDPDQARFLASRTDLLEPVPYTGGSTISHKVLVATGTTDSPNDRP